MAGPDLPRPREPFTSAHLQRWPMGAERTELLDRAVNTLTERR